MNIDQGFSMTLTPVSGKDGIFDLQLFSHLHINDAVSTRDRILGVMLTLDEQWARDIPADQFAYLAVSVAAHFLTIGQEPDAVASFKESIASTMESIVNPSLGK